MLCEGYFKKTKRCRNCEKKGAPTKDLSKKIIVQYHCHLPHKVTGLTQNQCDLKSQKAHTSFVPRHFRNFSGYGCLLIFENLIKMATERSNKIKRGKSYRKTI